MKRILLITGLLTIYTSITHAQKLFDDCGKYAIYLKKGDSAMKANNYGLAIHALQAARDCKPAMAPEVDKKLNDAFNLINQQKIKADDQAKALIKERTENQRKQIKIASERIALAAKDSLRYNPVKSLQRAAEAYQKHQSPVTMNVLMEAHQMHRYTKDSTLDQSITVITASPRQHKIALVKEESNIIYLYDSLTGKPRELYGHEDDILHIAFSPDGRYLASASEDHRTIKIWTSEGQFVRTLRNEPSIVIGMGFTPDGKSIITGSKDGIIRLWSITGNNLERKQYPSLLNIDFFTVSPNGKGILVVGSDQKLFYGSTTDNLKVVDAFATSGRVLSISLSPDGRSFAVSDSKLKVQIFNDRSEIKEQFQVKNYIVGMHFLNDRDIALATNDGPILLYQNEQSAELVPLIAHRGAVKVLYRIGLNLWSAGQDKTLKRWDYTRQKEPYRFTQEIIGLSNAGHLHTPGFELMSTDEEIKISPLGQDSRFKTILFKRGRLKGPEDTDKINGLIIQYDPVENKLVLKKPADVTTRHSSNDNRDLIISWALQEKGDCQVAFSEDGDYLLVKIIPTLNVDNIDTYEDQVKLLLYRTPAMVYKMTYPQNYSTTSKPVLKKDP